MTIRVLVADDQALVRAGFGMIVDAQEDMQVVAEAHDGREAVALCRETHPDVALMDIRMPVMDGIEATRYLTARAPSPATRVVILTTYDLDEYVYDALEAGASGFLLKDIPPEDLVRAVRVTTQGDALLAPSVTRRLIEQFVAARPVTHADVLGNLSPREIEVLRLLAQGMSNTEIAAALFIGESTVKTHIGHMLDKARLRDRVHAVILAYETGLVRPGQARQP